MLATHRLGKDILNVWHNTGWEDLSDQCDGFAGVFPLLFVCKTRMAHLVNQFCSAICQWNNEICQWNNYESNILVNFGELFVIKLWWCVNHVHTCGDLLIHWRNNDHDGVSDHQPHGCLLKRLFRRWSKKTSKLHITGLCVGTSPGPVNSPHKGPVTRKMFPFDDVIKCRAKV